MSAQSSGPSETRAKAELRRRSLQVSTFCIHTMAWVLLAFYATDYLPPLAIRGTVGLASPRLQQYLVGYAALCGLCLLLAATFGALYERHFRLSRYSWRWVVFPILVALFLIPAQGANEWLTRVLELAFLGLGMALGLRIGPALRRRRRAVPGLGGGG